MGGAIVSLDHNATEIVVRQSIGARESLDGHVTLGGISRKKPSLTGPALNCPSDKRHEFDPRWRSRGAHRSGNRSAQEQSHERID